MCHYLCFNAREGFGWFETVKNLNDGLGFHNFVSMPVRALGGLRLVPGRSVLRAARLLVSMPVRALGGLRRRAPDFDSEAQEFLFQCP